VKPGEKLDEVLSAFYERISTPMLTDLSLDFGKMSVYDLYPSPLPDLFAGSQVIVAGRYHAGGKADLTLKGTVNGQMQTFSFPGQNFSEDTRGTSTPLASLPRLWATRKIGYLLNLVRLKGADKETVDQIVQLSIRYGIVTPYTSYLVTEAMPLGAENQQRVANDALKSMQSAPPAAASGAGAVQRSAEQGALSQAQQAPSLSSDAAQTIAAVGAHTFVYSQNIWTDTAYDPKKMQTIKVAFLSPDYFVLSQSRADVAAALALGERVIVVVDKNAYEIVAETTGAGPLQITPGSATLPAANATPAVGTTPGGVQAATLLPAQTTRPALGRRVPAVGEWLPLALLGLGVLGAFGVSLFVWLRRKE
jgi:Ca-activated chloride channel family protein